MTFLFQCHFPELEATGGCLFKPDVNEARRQRWACSHGSDLAHFQPGKWFTQVPQDFPLCFRGSRESYTKLFSVSWLSSLTETKRLSFFLTPPNSLKCHRSAVSWCRTEQHFQCCFLSLNMSFGFVPVYFPPIDRIRVRFSSTISLVFRSDVPQQSNSDWGAMLPNKLLFI